MHVPRAQVIAVHPSGNFVFAVFQPQVGHYNVGYNGNVEVKTPHIDELASEGATFERMCVPPRPPALHARATPALSHMCSPTMTC